MAKDSDPTKDPEFQKVVQGFLRTKPTPHKLKKKTKSGKKLSRRQASKE